MKRQDGSRSLHGRGGDGRYHVDGKLEIATREETKRLVSTSILLLRAGGKCRKVILTPSGRYRYSPCCNVRGHCSNMKDSNYGRWMEEKMAEMRGIVRDYVRMRKIKRATVMEFGQLITPAAGQSSYLHEEEIWGEDPIHYTSKVYRLAAAGLESLVYQKRSEEREAEPSGGQDPSKKAKLDLTLKRPDWVKGSVAEAIRGTLEATHGRPSNRGNGEASCTISTEEPAAEAEALSEAAARIGDVERTEDAAAARTRGGEAGQAEATTIRSGSLAACPVV